MMQDDDEIDDELSPPLVKKQSLKEAIESLENLQQFMNVFEFDENLNKFILEDKK